MKSVHILSCIFALLARILCTTSATPTSNSTKGTTISIAPITTEGTLSVQWKLVGNGQGCDFRSSAERFLRESSKALASLKACQDSCAEIANCLSVTFYRKSKFCSLFSTPCFNLKNNRWAFAYRKITGNPSPASTITTTTTTTTPTTTITTHTPTASSSSVKLNPVPGREGKLGHFYDPVRDEILNAFADTHQYERGKQVMRPGFNNRLDEVYNVCDLCEYAPMRASTTSNIFSKYDGFHAYAEQRAASVGYSQHFDVGGAVTQLGGFLTNGPIAKKFLNLFKGNGISSSKSSQGGSSKKDIQTAGFVMYEHHMIHGVHQLSLKLHEISDYLLPWAREHIESLPKVFNSKTKPIYRDAFMRVPPFIVWRIVAGGAIRSSATISADSNFEKSYTLATQRKASSSGLLWWKKSSSSSSSTETERAEKEFVQQAVVVRQILGGDRVGFSDVDQWGEAEVKAWAITAEQDPKVVDFQIIPFTKFIRDKSTRDALALAMLDYYGKLEVMTPQEHEALRQAALATSSAERAMQAVAEVNKMLNATNTKLFSEVEALMNGAAQIEKDRKTDYNTLTSMITKAITTASQNLEEAQKRIGVRILSDGCTQKKLIWVGGGRHSWMTCPAGTVVTALEHWNAGDKQWGTGSIMCCPIEITK